jgi:hypothetical protein
MMHRQSAMTNLTTHDNENRDALTEAELEAITGGGALADVWNQFAERFNRPFQAVLGPKAHVLPTFED